MPAVAARTRACMRRARVLSSAVMTATDTHRTIDAVWRIESPRLIAALARIVHDVGLAEEFAQDALVSALEKWPDAGVPDNPAAWLMTAAKHRAIDRLRHGKLVADKQVQLALVLEDSLASARPEDQADDDIGDDLLRLVFVACHPVLSTEARVALTLRLLGGLATDEIARAFLVPEPTIAQRIVRAKRTLADKRVEFEVPQAHERAQRLASVLEVIYLIFNEGYAATAGDDWMRPALCADAMRLGRVLAGLMADEPEVHALVALMEIQASRMRARVDADGTPILLPAQNRALWDRLLIQHGLGALARAEHLGGSRGAYALQAAIAACHARARDAAATDWPRIADLYAELHRLTASPIVELNRAVAVSMAAGAQAGLDIADALRDEPALRGYHLLPTTRGDLLSRLGRLGEARIEFERAAALTRNERERAFLLGRARECAPRSDA